MKKSEKINNRCFNLLDPINELCPYFKNRTESTGFKIEVTINLKVLVVNFKFEKKNRKKILFIHN